MNEFVKLYKNDFFDIKTRFDSCLTKSVDSLEKNTKIHWNVVSKKTQKLPKLSNQNINIDSICIYSSISLYNLCVKLLGLNYRESDSRKLKIICSNFVKNSFFYMFCC